jgi:hypothetical protein
MKLPRVGSTVTVYDVVVKGKVNTGENFKPSNCGAQRCIALIEICRQGEAGLARHFFKSQKQAGSWR